MFDVYVMHKYSDCASILIPLLPLNSINPEFLKGTFFNHVKVVGLIILHSSPHFNSYAYCYNIPVTDVYIGTYFINIKIKNGSSVTTDELIIIIFIIGLGIYVIYAMFYMQHLFNILIEK